MGGVPPTVINLHQGEVPFDVVLLFWRGSNPTNLPPAKFSICSL
jgi:hypothetical protein